MAAAAASTSNYPTVYRVKRKLTDEPLPILELSLKKRAKNDFGEKAPAEFSDDDEDQGEGGRKEVFQFFGTTLNEENAALQCLKKMISRENCSVKSRTKISVADIRLKRRHENADIVKSQRKDKLNESRHVTFEPSFTEPNCLNDLNQLDVFDENGPGSSQSHNKGRTSEEETICCNGSPLIRLNTKDKHANTIETGNNNEEYVYDYYVPKSLEFDPLNPNSFVEFGDAEQFVANEFLAGLIDVRSYDVSEFNLDDDAADSEENRPWMDMRAGKDVGVVDDGVSEDSNDENNWKNEYPDEDDEFENRYDYYCQDYPCSEDENAANGKEDEVDDWTTGFEQMSTND